MAQAPSESKIGTWIIAVIALIVVVVCLVVVLINTGPGFTVEGQRVRLRLVSAVTNYPFCPPEIPCPISVVLNEDHWVIWVVREPVGADREQEEEPYFRKLIDIRLR